MQRKKRRKITLEKMVFRLFWTLPRKSCIFTGKFFAGLSKLLSTCPKEHLESNISERKSWKLESFWIFFEFFGTNADNFFQCWQNSDICPREQFMDFFFKREKLAIFSNLSDCLLPAKFFARVAKPAIYLSVEVFGEKHILKFIWSFTLLWIWIQKTLNR